MGRGREEMEGAEASAEPAARREVSRKLFFQPVLRFSAGDYLLPVPQGKERSLAPQQTGLVPGSAAPNAAAVFSISGAGRRVSALWQKR